MELVKNSEVFALVDANFTGSTVELERMMGRGDGYVRNMRRRRYMQYDTADKMLCALGLSHHLSMGDIEVIQCDYFGSDGPGFKRPQSRPPKDKALKNAKNQVYRTRLQRDMWKRRALAAEAKLKESQKPERKPSEGQKPEQSTPHPEANTRSPEQAFAYAVNRTGVRATERSAGSDWRHKPRRNRATLIRD